jgi:hypothetical protein
MPPGQESAATSALPASCVRSLGVAEAASGPYREPTPENSRGPRDQDAHAAHVNDTAHGRMGRGSDSRCQHRYQAGNQGKAGVARQASPSDRSLPGGGRSPWGVPAGSSAQSPRPHSRARSRRRSPDDPVDGPAAHRWSVVGAVEHLCRDFTRRRDSARNRRRDALLLDYWVTERREWWGRVRGADGQHWIRDVDLRRPNRA